MITKPIALIFNFYEDYRNKWQNSISLSRNIFIFFVHWRNLVESIQSTQFALLFTVMLKSSSKFGNKFLLSLMVKFWKQLRLVLISYPSRLYSLRHTTMDVIYSIILRPACSLLAVCGVYNKWISSEQDGMIINVLLVKSIFPNCWWVFRIYQWSTHGNIA